MNNTSNPWAPVSWLFGIVFFAIGIINMFWGNDPWFGVMIVLLSFIYFPPVTRLIKHIIGLTIHPIVKVVLGVFIAWAALGVGELFDKIGIMMKDF